MDSSAPQYPLPPLPIVSSNFPINNIFFFLLVSFNIINRQNTASVKY